MRRLCFSWVASFLLLLAQQGALLHELSHLVGNTHTAGATLREGGQALENGLCLTCEAFSQVTNPATAVAPHVPLSPPGLIPSPDPGYAVVAAHPPTPRSRGPPQV